jgi:hypothetical protein
MKNQTRVWLSAASLHDQGRAPFQRKELLTEVKRLFPDSNPSTIATYVDTQVRFSGGQPNSFNYLIRTSPGRYRLTKPGDENPSDKPRWPNQKEVDHHFDDLWIRWVTWQQEEVELPLNPMAPSGEGSDQETEEAIREGDRIKVQRLLQRHLTALLPPPIEVKYDGNLVVMNHSFEVNVRIGLTRFWMQTTRTNWDGHRPDLQPDRELVLPLDDQMDRSPEAIALVVISVVQAVFGPRLQSYSQCDDCGKLFPPERMTETWCHGCASASHGVVY